MKKYDSYKDSGIEWIGEIPEHWEECRLGVIGGFTSSGIDKKIVEDEPTVKIINYTDVYGNKEKILNTEKDYMEVTSPQSKINQHSVKKGDLIFTPSSETKEDIGLSAVVVDDLDNTAFSYHVLRFQFNKEVNLLFKKYLCNNYPVLNYFSKNSKGTTRQILGREDFKNAKVVIPPKSEQTAIANFLDLKTSEIDEIIADKKRLLELYEEEKTAIINQAVTKGINPDVPMKDSGIEWLGEIPEHWEVKRFDYLFDFSRGLPITKADLRDTGIPCVSYGEIHSKFGFDVDPNRDLLKCVDDKYLVTNDKSLLQSGDFVFADTSEDLEGSGNFTYLNSSVPTFAGYHTIIGKPIIEFERRYVAYYFNTLPFRNQVRSKVSGTKVFSITQAILKFTNIIFPLISEQQEIVDYIDNECARIDSKKERTEKLIELLTEYRTALISEVVTGKIKVIE
jgi:type I restriction enzyme S subunit